MVRNTDRLEVAFVDAEGACILLMLVVINRRHYLVSQHTGIDAVLVAQSAKIVVPGGMFVGVNSCQDPFLTMARSSLDPGRTATKRRPRN